MAKLSFKDIDDLKPLVGQELYTSDWLEITQERINIFAEATGDFQWLHVDVERCLRESPYGAPIAHGYLTLSLLAKFAIDSVTIERKKSAVNYGLNKVRFINPVRVGTRIRAKGTLAEFQPIEGGAQIGWSTVIEIEGEAKPACIAENIGRYYY